MSLADVLQLLFSAGERQARDEQLVFLQGGAVPEHLHKEARSKGGREGRGIILAMPGTPTRMSTAHTSIVQADQSQIWAQTLATTDTGTNHSGSRGFFRPLRKWQEQKQAPGLG